MRGGRFDVEDVQPGTPLDAFTDAAGRFVRARAPEGTLFVFVHRPGFLTFDTTVLAEEYIDWECELRVPRGRAIAGRVVNGVTGAPSRGW